MNEAQVLLTWKDLGLNSCESTESEAVPVHTMVAFMETRGIAPLTLNLSARRRLAVNLHSLAPLPVGK
jgi:hypothetical protein